MTDLESMLITIIIVLIGTIAIVFWLANRQGNELKKFKDKEFDENM